MLSTTPSEPYPSPPASSVWGLRGSILLVVCLLAPALSFAKDAVGPFDPTPAQAETVGQEVATIEELPTIPQRVDAYLALINAYGDRGELAPMLVLVRKVYGASKRFPTQQETDAVMERVAAEVRTDKLSVVERNQLKCALARFKAFGGNITTGEQELLEILALPQGDIATYTRAEAHYAIAYCGFYTDNLQHSAFHVARAAKLYLELGMSSNALEAFDGASTTYFRMGLVDSALHFARLGLKINPEIVDQATLNLALNYAEALMAVGRVDSALMYATRANDHAIATSSTASHARAEYSLGNLNMNLRRYSRAQKHYLQAEELFRDSKEVYHLSEVMDSLGTAFAKTGDFEAAYAAKSRAFQLKDSLRDDRLRKDVDIKVAKYERDRMARELDASEGERALAEVIISQRTTERIMLLGGGLLLVLALAFFIYRVRLRSALATQLQREVDVQTHELRERGRRLEAQTVKLSESNAELERFAYIASHDLKTPLRNVTSFLGLIRRRLPAESLALVEEYLDIAIGNARHMNELITDVLEYSRLNADLDLLAEEVEVTDVIARVRSGVRAELSERNAELQVVGDATLVLPKGTLDQLIGNLVANALKYNKSPRPLVKVVTVDMGDRVRISVADNGIGIAPEYHDRIFEVFRRLHTNDEYAGTGVGLAACRKIILRLGGDIRVESAVGAGATFAVDLPKQIGKARQASPAVAAYDTAV